jgi:shikimate kinase
LRASLFMDNIILIGFMGTGKTEVGRILARKLGFGLLDTDSLIEREQGKTISNIFNNEGESAFRGMESALLGDLAVERKKVISTGGGIILRPENIEKLKKLGPIVLLLADEGTIYERLKNKGDRPLLKVADPKKKIKEILGIRMPIYKGIADFQVKTDDLSPEEVSGKIMEFLKGRK